VLSAIVLGSVLLCFVVLAIAIVADSETLRHDEAMNLSLQIRKILSNEKRNTTALGH